MAIPDQPFGFVAGRWVLSLADTPMDSDRAPDYKPLYPGSVIFNNKLSHRVVGDGAGGTIGIVKTRYEAQLNEDGKLIDAEEHEFVALPVGVYSVTFSFGQYSWPNFDIEVKAEHTVDSPLWLPSKSPVPAGPGVVHVVSEEARFAAEAAALLAEGFSDSAEASALAASLASSERGVRVDTTVGTRVMLDHPGGTTMLYGDTGWQTLPSGGWTIGTLQIRRVGEIVALRVGDLESIGGSEPQIPEGFRPSTSTRWLAQAGYSPSSSQSGRMLMVYRTLRIVGTITEKLWATVPAEFTWFTTDPWPTVLPGTPATI